MAVLVSPPPFYPPLQVGTIQPIAEVAAAVARKQLALGETLGGGDGGGDGGGAGPILFHTDAAQSLGKVGSLPHHFPVHAHRLSNCAPFSTDPHFSMPINAFCFVNPYLSTLVHTSPQVGVDVRALGVDMATVVGHKFGAPKGVAALYIRYGRCTGAVHQVRRGTTHQAWGRCTFFLGNCTSPGCIY